MSKTVISTPNAPAAIGTYSQAIAAGNTIYISGQIALDPATGEVSSLEFAPQAHRVFDNLKAICTAADASLSNIVKLTIYLTDFGNFGALNQIMAEHMQAPYPARATVEVSGLPRGVLLEIDAIVVR